MTFQERSVQGCEDGEGAGGGGGGGGGEEEQQQEDGGAGAGAPGPAQGVQQTGGQGINIIDIKQLSS